MEKTLLLVKQFLQQNRFENALQALEMEAGDLLEEASYRHRLDKPLVAIVEEQEMQELKHQFDKSMGQKEMDQLLDGPLLTVCKETGVYHLHKGNILCVRVAETSNGKMLVTGSSDKTLQITDAGTGQIVSQLVLDAPVLSISVDSNDPETFACSTMDGKLLVINVNGKIIQSFEDHVKYVNNCKISPSGDYLASGSHDKTVNVYKRQMGLYSLETKLDLKGIPESMVFTQTHLILGVRGDHELTCFDLATEQIQKVNMNVNGDDWVSFTPMSLSVSPSGKHLLVYTDSKAGRVIIYETLTSRIVQELWGVLVDDFDCPQSAWHPNGRYVACTSNDNTVHVFDLKTKSVIKIEGHLGTIRGLDFSQNDLYTCSYDKTVRCWLLQ
ncbi:WD40-repeat-containing domain protein [Gorgonomyces haynaldii]|nr:WD40-repeat-containing domain protein [Gorgonomyces haynaldii]